MKAVLFVGSKCIFCEIINGEQSAKKIYEDDVTLAFLAKSNDVFGHTLIIPKQHVHVLLDGEQTILNQTMRTLKQVATYYVENFGFSGMSIPTVECKKMPTRKMVFFLHFLVH